jgi:transposase
MSAGSPLPADLWDCLPPEARALILALRAEVAELRVKVREQQQHIEALRERLSQNSINSSRPPSTDPQTVKRRPPRPTSGRSAGGQPGHERQQRPLLPPDHTEVLKPSRCRGCGHVLHGDDLQPLRHQVLELPKIRPAVTEYRLHRLRCPACGLSTCASLPAGVPTGGQGPRLQAVLALMTGAYRMSKRMVQTFCADVLGVPVCAGQVCASEAETAAATEPVVEQLREYVRSQPANVDETGWWQKRQRGWLWTVVTQTVTVFAIALSRAGSVAQRLVDPAGGQVITTDRYKGYLWLPLRQRQICWAHLIRDFQAMVDRGNAGSGIGEELLCCAQDLFTWWYRVRDGTLRRSTFRQYMGVVRSMVREQLEAGAVCGCAKTAGVCRELLTVEPALWTFVRVEGIEPTNNAAERALRHAVLWRKTSHGTNSAAGSRFVENILSIVATCRQQGRAALEYLTECCRSRLAGEAAPTLLPQGAGYRPPASVPA